MTSRRTVALGILGLPLLSTLALAADDETSEVSFKQLVYPRFETLGAPELFGYEKPNDEQRAKAAQIIANTPQGPQAIDVAQSFVDRFYKSDPDAISQWPAPAAWNPLVVAFFGATATPANNDMIAWCAAFANFCIERNGGKGSRSASSQSFLAARFKKTTTPTRGDLAVFTCFDPSSGQSVGLGHVTFFQEKIGSDKIQVVGGNQSADGHSSIISANTMSILPRAVKRHVGSGKYVDTTMKLNCFVALS